MVLHGKAGKGKAGLVGCGMVGSCTVCLGLAGKVSPGLVRSGEVMYDLVRQVRHG